MPDDILGSTVNIDATQAQNTVASAMAGTSSDGGAQDTHDSIIEGATSSADATSGSADDGILGAATQRTRRQSPDALEREQLRTQAARARSQAAEQVLRAATARADKAVFQAAQAGTPASSGGFYGSSASDDLTGEEETRRARATFDSDFESSYAGPDEEFDYHRLQSLTDSGLATGSERGRAAKSRRVYHEQQKRRQELGSDPDGTEITDEEQMRRAELTEEHSRFLGMDPMEAAFAVAYGGSQTLNSVSKAIQPALSGESYLPGQAQEQTETSLLPLVGGIVGTAIGMRFGPGGSLAGQFVGQSVGQGIEEAVDTYTGGHTFAQERAGQSLGEGRGGADAIKEFTDALQNAATPAAKELAESLAKIGQSGPVSAGAASSFGQLQFDLGTNYAPTVDKFTSFLDSSSALYGARTSFGTKGPAGLSADDDDALAQVAAASGDYTDMQAALAVGEAARSTHRSFSSGLFPTVKDGRSNLDNLADYSKTHNIFETAGAFFTGGEIETTGKPQQDADKKAAADAEAMISGFKTRDADLEERKTDLTSSESALKGALARGGGAAAIRDAEGGIKTDVLGLSIDLYGEADEFDKIGRGKSAAAPEARKRAAELRAQIAEISVVPDELSRQAFQTEEQETEAGYGLRIAQGTRTVESGFLSGKSYADLAGAERTAVRARRQDAYHLFDVAADPSNPLSPSERLQMRKQGTEELTQAQQEQNRFNVARADYSVRASGQDVQRAGIAEDAARLYGSPSQAYDAAQESVKKLSAEFDTLTQILANAKTNGLTADQIQGYQSQRLDVQRQIQDQTAESYKAQIAGNLSIGGSSVSGDAALAELSRYTGGSGASASAFDSAITAQQALIAQQTAASIDPKSGNDVERAGYRASAAQGSLELFQMRVAQTEYAPAPGLASQEEATRGQLYRMSKTFLEPGNVMDAQLAAVRQDTQDISAYDAQIKKLYGDHIPTDLLPSVTRERERLKNQRADDASAADTGYFDRLPSLSIGGASIAGEYMPSAAQAAAYTERVNPTLAVRTFGGNRSESFRAVMEQDGTGLVDAGKTYAGTRPGDMSAAGASSTGGAIAEAVTKSLDKALKNLSITNNVTIPGFGTSSIKSNANQANLRSQGMSAVAGTPGSILR